MLGSLATREHHDCNVILPRPLISVYVSRVRMYYVVARARGNDRISNQWGYNCEVADWIFSERRVLVLRNNYTEPLAPRRYGAAMFVCVCDLTRAIKWLLDLIISVYFQMQRRANSDVFSNLYETEACISLSLSLSEAHCIIIFRVKPENRFINIILD